MVPLSMMHHQDAINAESILDLLTGEQTILVYGSSGCGKSHLLNHLAWMASARRCVPVIARAAEFAGDLAALLNNAVTTIAFLDFEALVIACKREAWTPVVIIDAINECPSGLRLQLVAAIQKLRTRFDFPIVLSDQTKLALPPTLQGPVIAVSPPNAHEKAALVGAYVSGPLPDNAEFSLSIISSAQDAVVWAEVFSHLGFGGSRYALYDAYVNRRLANTLHRAMARQALASLAHDMRRNFVFAVPLSALRRAIESVIGKSADIDEIEAVIQRSDLLITGQGHSAFKHELLQDFFASDEILRITARPEELGQLLTKPLYAGLAEFVIGALSTSVALAACLSPLHSPSLLAACLRGRCGSVAFHYVKGESAQALERLRSRYCAMVFDAEDREPIQLLVDDHRAQPFQPSDKPYLAVAMMVFPDGHLIEDVLRVVRQIDLHIEDERTRLRAKYPGRKIAWRALMFSGLYSSPTFNGPDDLRIAIQDSRFGGLWHDESETYAKVAALLSGYANLTPGQLYFLIQGFHSSYRRDAEVPPFLFDLAKRAWDFRIYHLQLATSHMLTLHCGSLPEAERQRFIALVESWLDNDNPFVNSFVIDVLKVLGALDDAFTATDAQAEIDEILELPESPEANEAAFSVYCRQFDHPYDGAYVEAFNELSAAKKEALFARAVETTETCSMFYSFLLTEVARSPTSQTVAALQRVASVPMRDTSSTQESVSTFVMAIVALAELGVPLLPADHENDPLMQSWHSMGRILFALHTPGTTPAEYEVAAHGDWSWLEHEELIDCPMRILRDRWRDNDQTSERFLEWSKERLLRMSRANLKNKPTPRSWFRFPEGAKLAYEHEKFSLGILGQHGNRSDLPIIAAFVDNTALGTFALQAAQAIEKR
ncbi:hypothetical protein LMIY3S_03647 [Labrys miyagiensis]